MIKPTVTFAQVLDALRAAGVPAGIQWGAEMSGALVGFVGTERVAIFAFAADFDSLPADSAPHWTLQTVPRATWDHGSPAEFERDLSAVETFVAPGYDALDDTSRATLAQWANATALLLAAQ